MLLSYLNLQQPILPVIEGKVVCNFDRPLKGAQVYFVPRLEETLTSDDGVFKLPASQPLPLTLIVSHQDYESCRITIYGDNPKQQVISLKSKQYSCK
jgi:hypothetical protein